MNNYLKHCSCGKPVKGRTDKKFCGDFCRNQFNNQRKAPTNNLIRNINNALSKNRRILESCYFREGGFSKLNKDLLLNLGYQFSYFTHTLKSDKGHVYYFCYDLGFREESDEIILTKTLLLEPTEYIKQIA